MNRIETYGLDFITYGFDFWFSSFKRY